MNIMTKRGQLDNIVTYEHYCDTYADIANIPENEATLGSVAVVLKGKSGGFEVYMANSKKEWTLLSSGSGGGGSYNSDNIVGLTFTRQNMGTDILPDFTMADLRNMSDIWDEHFTDTDFYFCGLLFIDGYTKVMEFEMFANIGQEYGGIWNLWTYDGDDMSAQLEKLFVPITDDDSQPPEVRVNQTIYLPQSQDSSGEISDSRGHYLEFEWDYRIESSIATPKFTMAQLRDFVATYLNAARNETGEAFYAILTAEGNSLPLVVPFNYIYNEYEKDFAEWYPLLYDYGGEAYWAFRIAVEIKDTDETPSAIVTPISIA